MIFNENQHFYAALWWMAHLPGGADHGPIVLARHNKPAVAFPAFTPERGRKQANPFRLSAEEYYELKDQEARGFNPADEILPPDALDRFFETLYAALKEEKDVRKTSQDSCDYIKLHKSCAVSSISPTYPNAPFPDALESAIQESGITRYALPVNGATYTHHDGRVFVNSHDGPDLKITALDYPGCPALPYRNVALRAADMEQHPRLTWETLYRIVPLKPGQTYKSGWTDVSGERCFQDDIAREDQILCIGNHDVAYPGLLRTLTDEEILNAHESLRGSFARDKEEVTPGYRDSIYDSYIEAGDQPNIVRHLSPDIAYMIVREKVQIGFGSSFAVAEPGDFIIRESPNSSPRVMHKALIDCGRVRFILPPAAPGRKPPAPGLN